MPKHINKKCCFCGGCAGVCPENVITVWEDNLKIDEKNCKECNFCVQVCPLEAMVKE